MTPIKLTGPGARSYEVGGNDYAFLRSPNRPTYAGQRPLRLVDLFAGCGGFTLGVAEACRVLGRGLDVRLAVERNPDVWAIYLANFGALYRGGTKDELVRAHDVNDVFDGKADTELTTTEVRIKGLVGEVDLLVGGPPCQGHSNLNNHTRRRDPKNALYERMVRAARVLAPRAMLIENVIGLRHDKGGVLQHAEAQLRELGYRVSGAIVGLRDLGVPQLRKRHLLVATRGDFDLAGALELGRTRRRRTLEWAIGDLRSAGREQFIDKASKLSAANERRARWLRDKKKFDLPNRKRPKCHKEDPDNTYKSMYGRLRWGAPAQTITSGFGSPGQGRYLHPSQLRTLTPHEAARIQFLPDWFDFGQLHTRKLIDMVIGNAVPPKLGFVLALNLLDSWETAAPRQDSTLVTAASTPVSHQH